MKNVAIGIGLFVFIIVVEILGEVLLSFLQGHRNAKTKDGKFIVRYRLFVRVATLIIGIGFSSAIFIPVFLVQQIDFGAKISLIIMGFVFLSATALGIYAIFRRRVVASQDSLKIYFVFHRAAKISFNQIVSAEYNEHLQLTLVLENGLKFGASDEMVGVEQLNQLVLEHRPDLFLDNLFENTNDSKSETEVD